MRSRIPLFVPLLSLVLPLAHLLGGLAAVMVFDLSTLWRAIGRPRLRAAGEARST